METIVAIILAVFAMLAPVAPVDSYPILTDQPITSQQCDTDDFYMIPECMEAYNE